MYHSSGNYEAFVHPRKPEGVENKSAYIVGTGLAGLSAAIFLVRDAQMPGENIHILEVSPVAGGALDGAYIEGHGYGNIRQTECDTSFCTEYEKQPELICRNKEKLRATMADE